MSSTRFDPSPNWYRVSDAPSCEVPMTVDRGSAKALAHRPIASHASASTPHTNTRLIDPQTRLKKKLAATFV